MTIQEVLTAAIADFEEHGFDNQERLDRWESMLREAIRVNVKSQTAVEDELRRALRAMYDRLVNSAQVLRAHPGVEKFRLTNLAPRLRSELERRIMASAQLIKLNRAEMIEKTLRRFSGWMSSVPPGGSETIDKAQVKAEVSKPMRSLPFVERRVLIDQGHKLNSSISAVLAYDSGAIAAVWRSNWRQANYDFREDHKARDGKVYLVRDSWAVKQGLVKVGRAGWSDDVTQPAEEPFCFPGSTEVPFVRGVEKAFRHWYSGDLAEIVTSSGKTLRVTPNHPILTDTGWCAAGLLNEGDNVVEVTEEVARLTELNFNNRVPKIDEIFGALDVSGQRVTHVGSAANFHGDGSDGDVDVVFAAGGLLRDREVQLPKSISKFIFSVAVHCGRLSRSLGHCFVAILRTAHRSVSCLCETLSSFWSLPLHPEQLRLVPCSESHPQGPESSLYSGAANIESLPDHLGAFSSFVAGGDFIHRQDAGFRSPDIFPGHVGGNPVLFGDGVELVDLDAEALSTFPHRFVHGAQLSKVVQVNRRRFAGHVYNLQTLSGWYAVEGIIAHNCRCYYNYLYHLRKLPDDMLTVKGRDALTKARAA